MTDTPAPASQAAPVALPEPTTDRPVPGQLTFQAPRRGKPPRHLADFSPAERKEAVEALGHKGFRAKQLSTHYFERLVDDPEEMTDLPKAVRSDLVTDLLPTLLTPIVQRVADDGQTMKYAWRLHEAAIGAIRRLTDPAPDGLGMSARGITMSTVGLVPGIDKLAAEGIPVTLALSLHAPDDELRNELVPINTRWSVDEALDAAYRYFEATGRRVSIEYALIRDINDQGWRADLLGEKLNRRGRGWVHVNPIPLNPTPGSKWTASRPGVEQNFVERLRAHGIPTTIRDTRGQDIDGACGQLAAATA